MAGFRLGGGEKTKPKPERRIGRPSALLAGDDSDSDSRDAKPTPSQMRGLGSNIRSKPTDAVDPAIYDYDGAFDAIHAADTAKKVASQQDAIERKPKYIDAFLSAADRRKKDQTRAQEKLLLRQRELEGDKFADKDQFVTAGYRRQIEQNRLLDQAEAADEAADQRRRETTGMNSFYRSVIEADDRSFQQSADATALVASGHAVVETAIEPTGAETAQSALAADMAARGIAVAINDDGQIADKRQLLTAGLNVAARPTGASRSGRRPRPSDRSSDRPPGPKSARAGPARQTRGRVSAEVEQQIQAAAERAAAEQTSLPASQEAGDRPKKTASDIESARARYLARKAVCRAG